MSNPISSINLLLCQAQKAAMSPLMRAIEKQKKYLSYILKSFW